MGANDLLETLGVRPFEPFRLVMTDGAAYDIRHPDLLWVGARSVMVGLAADPASPLWERSVRVDLLHIVRLEPLAPATGQGNGQATA